MLERPPTGFYLTLAGPEGVGKTTQLAQLVQFFESEVCSANIVITKEPGATAVGRELRAILLMTDRTDIDPETEVSLFAADRSAHLREVVVPALMQGKVVISDRSVFDSFAYQGFGSRLGIEAVKAANNLAVGNCWPDLAILFDLPVEIGLARKYRQQEVNRFELKDIAYHQRVQRGFLNLARIDRGRFIIVNADQPPAGVTSEMLAKLRDWRASHKKLFLEGVN